uniref:Uncharacterized protein n=1 Tax=Lepeophtheirus salmonis TaxID=72036 RepID=A0A0K2UN35_LEPSM
MIDRIFTRKKNHLYRFILLIWIKWIRGSITLQKLAMKMSCWFDTSQHITMTSVPDFFPTSVVQIKCFPRFKVSAISDSLIYRIISKI